VSHEIDKLRQELEAITTRGEPSEDALVSEAAPLRDGWLALGRLLDEADSSLGEPAETWRMAPPHRQRRWTVATIVVLAASLLLALAVAWALRPPRMSDVAEAPDSGQMLENRVQPVPVRVPAVNKDAPVPETIERPKVAVVPDELRWDDSLDEQITSAAETLIRVQQDWCYQTGRVESFRKGLQQLEKDAVDGTL
jgi:hypothetical protein